MKRNFTIIFLLFFSIAYAQKKPVDHNVYDSWESVGVKQLSNNGEWVSYTILQQEGDATLYLNNLNTNAKIKVPRGNRLQFTADSKFAAFTIKPFYATTRQEKIKKKKPEDMSKDSLGLVNLAANSIFKIARVKSFEIPEKGGAFVAYQLEKSLDTAKKSKSVPDKAGSKKEGTDLIVRNLVSGTERTFKYVDEFVFSKNGKQLAFAVTGSSKDSLAKAGAFLLDTETGKLKTLVSGKGSFKGFVFDEEAEYIAFLGEQSPEKAEIKDFNIYYSSSRLDTAQILVDKQIPGMPGGWTVSEDGKLEFNKDANHLFFGIAPEKKPKDTSLVEFEHAKLDIWGYKDDYLQPMQLKNAEREIKRNYLTSIDIFSSDPKIVPLTDVKLPEATLINEGNSDFVLASTDFGNRVQIQWTGNSLRDYYLVNMKNGTRKKIIEGLSGYAFASPGGTYVLYFDRRNSNWFTYHIATVKTVQLNKDMNVKFVDEENDVPDDPSAYGLAGWTEGDKSVLLYDRYDIWEFNPEGKVSPKNITNSYGRQNNITFRIQNIDQDARFLSKKERVWLSAFNNVSKENGFFSKNIGDDKSPELAVMSKNSYSRLVKAKDANRVVYDKGNYTNSPDVYASTDFKTEMKLSSTNPQQKNFNWGTAELVKWATPKGFKSEGILYKPENFDPSKKYPMIVYFYEKLSDGLYSYQAPAPTPSRLNIPFFVSNGYLVFAPDISYEKGYPSRSAEEFINSGVESLKRNAWVDGTKIGIQGQSWGGYQVAHLITRTNMYAAAWAGAPVVNMTSAYGGIRWESGMNRQFQYEKTQSRIGATLWENPDLYIENSPLFFMPKVNTPVVIMANDADGAVPWYQGIEMFTALKRLGKPVWMLNYNNEAHNLVQRQNRKDISIREQQFFDYYLKGAKAPVWMVSGVPATEKGKTWGFELTDGQP